MDHDTESKEWRPSHGIILRVVAVREMAPGYAANAAPAPGFSGAADVHAMMHDHMSTLLREEFWVLCLDVKNRITGCSMVSAGTLDASLVHPRDVFLRAIMGNAAAIIVVHNHPSGDPEPSAEDVTLTRRLADAGELLGIPILDHIVIGREIYVSLAERGVL